MVNYFEEARSFCEILRVTGINIFQWRKHLVRESLVQGEISNGRLEKNLEKSVGGVFSPIRAVSFFFSSVKGIFVFVLLDGG